MSRIVFIAFLVLTVFFTTRAQQPTQTIRGTVNDQASNAPIPYANIQIQNTGYGTTSDSLGNFKLKNVGLGRYTIKVSMVGYEPFVAKEVQVSSGKELLLNIFLKETINSLSEVIVKPRVNKEQPLNSQALVSAKMLSVEEANRYAGGFDDPARLVSSFAGISSNVSNNSIVVRGNSPQSLQWKMEGVEIPNPNHFADLSSFGGGALTALSSQLLSNSDFFSGAMPAEYGNALSGVFDIFMRNGNNQKAEHTFQLGLLGIDASSEGPFKKGGRSSFLFNYRYSTLALLEPIMPENAGGTTYQDLSFKLNFPTKKSGTFSIWGIGLKDGSGAEAKTDTTQWRYTSDRESQDVQQFMGAAGIGHSLNLNKRQYMKSTLAATVNGIQSNTNVSGSVSAVNPKNSINNQNVSVVLSSFINTKFSAKHSNKTGFVVTGMMYDLLLKDAPVAGNPLRTIVSENGHSTLLSAYSNSTFHFSDKTTMNLGVNGQYFTLTGHKTLEPRVGLKYQLTPKQTLSIAYGLHSRLERLNYYFVKNLNVQTEELNKKLDFAKAHHFVLGLDRSISELVHIKVEAYYQHLFNVPVIPNSTFSIINLQNDWFFKEKLENTGIGKNYGIDLTFERYLSKGYYYMVTASLFNSQYKVSDGLWRNTRYDRDFVYNFLIGKEWQTGKGGKNTLGVNARLSYQGGDHYSPIDLTASNHSQEAVFNEEQAFSLQFPPAFTTHFTASYKINKAHSAHTIAIKILNATNYQEFTGFQYNLKTLKVDERREALMLPNVSYKIEF